MNLMRRLLSHSLALAAALALALLAMQAPAVTHDYAAALLQIAREMRDDVDQRIATARRVHAIAAADEDGVIAALGPTEPANAASLRQSIDRLHHIEAAYRRLDDTSALLRPLVALADALGEDGRDRAVIWSTLFESYTPGISLSLDAGAYALAGLVLGALAAELVLGLARAALRLALGRRAIRSG